MVDANVSDGAPSSSRNEEGVLANLPRTRPQRSSPRRAAARATAAGAKQPRKPAKANSSNGKPATKRTATAPGPGSVAEPSKGARRRTSAPRRAAVKIEDPAPRQGFECEAEPTGGSINPPGGAELVASAAEIVGELAKAGLTTGERLVKDVLARLPLS